MHINTTCMLNLIVTWTHLYMYLIYMTPKTHCDMHTPCHMHACANVHVYHDHYMHAEVLWSHMFCLTFCSILTECSEIQCQIINRNNRDVVRKKCNLYNIFIFPNGRKLLTESNCSYILHIEYIYLLQYLWSLLTMKMHLLSVSMMTMLASEERLFGGKYVGNWSSNEQLLQIET